MPKTPSSRLFFAVIVAVLVSIIGRNLYRRYLNSHLFAAVEAKDTQAVRALLARGADVNSVQTSPDGKYKTSILKKAFSSQMAGKTGEIVCLLIEHGANLHERGAYPPHYLTEACNSDSVAVVRCLLEHGADPNETSSSSTGSMPVDAALSSMYIIYGNPAGMRTVDVSAQKAARSVITRQMVDLLRQHGARFTPLQAVQANDAALLRAALASGANVNQQDQNGQTALYAAAEKGSLPLMDMLLKAGADPKIATTYSGPALSAAAGYKGNLEAVKLLLAHGAKINSVGKNFDPPLVTAIASKHADIARLLLAHKADPNLERTVNNYVGSPLAVAAANLPELVPDLLAHRADINGNDGAPLQAAITVRNTDLVRYLLARGAKIYPAISQPLFTTPGRIPGAKPQIAFVVTPSTLQTAVTYSPECFEILMRAGARLGNDKADILLAAASAGRAALFDRLIALGANVNAATSAGSTPLIEALKYAPAGVQTLLEHGANPNAVAMGQTPLLIVVQAGNANMVRLLLMHGADVNTKPPRSHTPLYYAHRHKNAHIIKLLEQAGAKEE